MRAIALCSLMLALLAGCGGGQEPQASAPPQADASRMPAFDAPPSPGRKP